MVKQVQIRRGTTVENDMYTGAQGELTMDTEKKELRLHDGTTQGGITFGDPVVEFQRPTAENNYTWYRKYKSGWVEQGGRSGGRDVTITMPVEMSDNHYVVLTDIVGRVGYNALNWEISSITTTGFRCFYDGDSSDPTEFSWQVNGMAA